MPRETVIEHRVRLPQRAFRAGKAYCWKASRSGCDVQLLRPFYIHCNGQPHQLVHNMDVMSLTDGMASTQ